MRDDVERLKQDHAAYVAKLKEGHREELYAMQERLQVFYAFHIPDKLMQQSGFLGCNLVACHPDRGMYNTAKSIVCNEERMCFVFAAQQPSTPSTNPSNLY